MEKVALLETLKTLAATEDVLSVAREISEIRTRFDDVVLEEERLFQIKQLEAKERGETPEEAAEDIIRNEFYEIYSVFRDKRKVAQGAKKEVEEANLRRKKALIARLTDVIEKEENIGAALTAYKEIHDAWKEVGDIPRDKRQDVQSEYSRLLETFFYHIKIYRDLREHDLHRNHQLKTDVIARVKALETNTQMKEVEQALKALQNEWDETGPVNNDDWEKLKTEYWESVKTIYNRIQAFYEERRTEQTVNLEKKKALVARAIAFVADAKPGASKEWETATEQLLAMQEEWKHIGFGPRKENEEVWKEFRAACDAFFGAKKAHFDSLRSQFDAVAEKKQALVNQVESFKDSTDWKGTTEKILKIQKQWKELGNAGQRFEQKLWKDFRTACDAFFNAKQANFAAQDDALKTNLVAKKALIEKISTAVLPEDKKAALALLKEFATEFNAIGFVPMKEKDAIFVAYREALNGHYQKLNLEGEEQEKVLFQARLDTLKASPNADRAIDKERQDIKEKMNQLKSDILQYENNLGFFANSKGADALRKEVDSKINSAKRKIEELQRKLRMLS